MSDLYFKQVLLGPMANYVYFIGSKRTHEVLLVDPAWDIQKLLDMAAADGYKVTGVLVTHYHPDHVGGNLFGQSIEGLGKLMALNPCPIYVNKHEAHGMQVVTGLSATDLKLMASGDTVQVGDVAVKLIHTPGHTPGSQCFLVEERLVSGDTLFISGCGRVDLPGADPAQMWESLTQKLAKLPEATLLFPGHNYGGSESTIGIEKKQNPYLQVPTLDDWMARMGR